MPTDIKPQFYVYVLRDPRPGKNLQPIYVGKGKKERSKSHWRESDKHKNPLLRSVFAKLREAGLEPVAEVVQRFDIEADAFRLEIELIAQHGRRDLKTGTLCNLTDGGEGHSGNLATVKRSREKMNKLWADPKFVKAKSEISRAVMLKLNSDPDFAKASAKRSRENLRKLQADPEFKKANAEMLKIVHADPKIKKAASDRMYKMNADPEIRKRQSETLRVLHADPVFHAANAEILRKAREMPGVREAAAERMNKLHADPNFAKAHSERMRKQNADPEFQARKLAALRAAFAKKRAAKEAAQSSPS
jgi:hypothetical protein